MTTGTTTLDAVPAPHLADDDLFARDLIGGRWQFPAAPYDFEIRNPADSSVTTVVPLSSRFDVDRAVAAADRAARGEGWADPSFRARVLRRIVDELAGRSDELAALQATETGLADEDSRDAVAATVVIARGVLRCGATPSIGRADAGSRVSGHILSWGLPLTEIVTSTLLPMLRGEAVVVKPSLRGALSPVAFAQLAHTCGLPPGIINIVQGTGVDVGAALLGRSDLCVLHVRGNSRTCAQARRATVRTGVALHEISAGGNAVIVGPGRLDDADLDRLVAHLAAGTRLHAGPFGLPLLALHEHADPRITPRLVELLADVVAAPLPTDAMRRRALARITSLNAAGAQTLLGGRVPDDVAHRMGWRIPPTVLQLGTASSPAARREQHTEPLGPVLSILSWQDWSDVVDHVAVASRHSSGTVLAWGTDPGRGTAALAESGLVLNGVPVTDGRDVPCWPHGDALAPRWTAAHPTPEHAAGSVLR